MCFSDKWVGYDYGAYSPSYSNYDYGIGKFVNEATDNGVAGRLGNGLSCFTCHGRLRMGEAETGGGTALTSNNAWYDCADNGASVECRGDQRSCLTEERRRNDVVVEVKAMCKNPEACMYQWRRNERYMPPFHLNGDSSQAAAPAFFDDECRLSQSKHGNARAQWESVCRRCCAATDAAANCNGPLGNVVVSPIAFHCGGEATCFNAVGSGTTFSHYGIEEIQPFMETFMHHNRAHPGDGRNSLPEDKFVARKDLNGGTLAEQADRLSTEDTDFHNNRPATGTVNGDFGAAAGR